MQPDVLGVEPLFPLVALVDPFSPYISLPPVVVVVGGVGMPD
jgi:hypothetical protein